MKFVVDSACCNLQPAFNLVDDPTLPPLHRQDTHTALCTLDIGPRKVVVDEMVIPNDFISLKMLKKGLATELTKNRYSFPMVGLGVKS